MVTVVFSKGALYPGAWGRKILAGGSVPQSCVFLFTVMYRDAEPLATWDVKATFIHG